MKSKFTLILLVAIALVGIPAVAQHGHGGGGGAAGANLGGHGHSMGSSSDDSHSTSTNSNSHSTEKQSTVSERLSDNTRLANKLQSLLPAGTNLQQASQGFKNLGQFVAAVHVSHNLGIPFDQLKAKLTGSSPESLGKAIDQLKPDADSKAETKKANKQAQQDMDDTSGKS